MLFTFEDTWLSKLKFKVERLNTFSDVHNIEMIQKVKGYAREGFFVFGGERIWCCWCLASFSLTKENSERINKHEYLCKGKDLKQDHNRQCEEEHFVRGTFDTIDKLVVVYL